MDVTSIFQGLKSTENKTQSHDISRSCHADPELRAMFYHEVLYDQLFYSSHSREVKRVVTPTQSCVQCFTMKFCTTSCFTPVTLGR
ncbi:hypothetical protein RRG08_063410 [Elysia crispata]|uniref:Uncharacterized protein n=1 Tax=Elysia crispata TaxID=231223 RepID=A0AAE1DW57_9GAST|nr:hypothetical protein RRG08_063410 [Elysia crispata]